VTKTAYREFAARVLHAAQVWLLSVSYEEHFSLEAETVFRPYLASHCSVVTETSKMLLTIHALNVENFTQGNYAC
jgi:hypothetical protein